MALERYKCDRNGGVPGYYLRRQQWTCPSCGDAQDWSGHICFYCRRRICCQCFDHMDALCLDPAPLETRLERCEQARKRKGLAKQEAV